MANDLFQFLAVHVTVPGHDLVGQPLFFNPEGRHLKAVIFKEAAALDTLRIVFSTRTKVFDGDAEPFLRIGCL